MAVPNSYLLTAPEGSGDLLGRGIPSRTLLDGLKKVDKRIWTTSLFGEETCIWRGEAGNKENSKKLSSVPIGVVPEFTQLTPDGLVFALGWRRILEKCVNFGGLNRGHVENAIGVTLTVEGHDGFCWSCKKAGKLVKATSKGQQCDMHRQILDTVKRAAQDKADKKSQRRMAW